MGTVGKVNDIICDNISKIDDILKANANKLDDNFFCPAGPTPTPTPTPTVTPTPTPTPTATPTPTPCPPYCCYAELCYDDRDCSAACQCNDVRGLYLHIPCADLDCSLEFADGIYNDDACTEPADKGYYSNGSDCWYWDSDNLTLTYQGGC
jgi:hypothetical protein